MSEKEISDFPIPIEKEEIGNKKAEASMVSEKKMIKKSFGELDTHILTIVEWLEDFETIKNKIAESGFDQDLESEINTLQDSLLQEIGMRIWCGVEDYELEEEI